MPADILIRGARILDGTGNPWFYGDIAVSGGRVTSITTSKKIEAKKIIDATGLFVAPGFVDCHSHADFVLADPNHPDVAEASAIGIDDEVKGQAIAAFVVLKKGIAPSEAVHKEIISLIRDRIGPIATPKILNIVDKLPKTRSGKTMRRVLRALCEQKDIGDLSTIEDGASVDEVRKVLDEMRATLDPSSDKSSDKDGSS